MPYMLPPALVNPPAIVVEIASHPIMGRPNMPSRGLPVIHPLNTGSAPDIVSQAPGRLPATNGSATGAPLGKSSR